MNNLIYFIVACVFLTNCASISQKYISPYPNSWSEVKAQISDSLYNLPNDFEKTTFLRNFAAQTSIWGNDLTINHFWYYPVDSFYQTFTQKEGTVFCGGISYYLQRIFEDFGYESMQLNMGCENLYTHQTTLVKIKYLNDSIWIIQDATYNHNFTKTDYTPLSFNELLTLIYNNDYSNIHINEAPLNQSLTLSKNTWGKESSFEAYKTENGNKIYKYNRSINDLIFSDDLMKKINKCLKDNNLPQNVMALYRLPLTQYLDDKVIKIYESNR